PKARLFLQKSPRKMSATSSESSLTAARSRFLPSAKRSRMGRLLSQDHSLLMTQSFSSETSTTEHCRSRFHLFQPRRSGRLLDSPLFRDESAQVLSPLS